MPTKGKNATDFISRYWGFSKTLFYSFSAKLPGMLASCDEPPDSPQTKKPLRALHSQDVLKLRRVLVN